MVSSFGNQATDTGEGPMGNLFLKSKKPRGVQLHVPQGFSMYLRLISRV